MKMHYTYALLTNVVKVIIALCPENFCASKSAHRKVLNFWAFDWRTLQHQLQQLFWSHISPTFHEWHPFDNHLYFIFIIMLYMFIIVNIIRILYNYNIIQYSPPTPSLHHSHHYQWFRQENFLTTLRVGHQMNFSSLDANFLSINIIFISTKIINSNITINTYGGVNWRSDESLEIIESASQKNMYTL